MRDQARVLQQTAVAGFAELRALYTWRSWVFQWLARLLFQVAFYALLGRLLQSEEQTRFLVIGNAVFVVTIEACVIILSAVGERYSGTLALMVAAPATHLTVYLGRGMHFLASGIASSTVAFYAMTAVFGVSLPWPQALLVPPMIVVIGLAAYGYGATLAAVVLGWPNLRWVVLNLSYAVLLAFAGVNVPIAYWPGWLETLANLLPLTHGLQAVRALLDGAAVTTILADLGWELCVGAGWFTAAAYGFHRMVRVGRANGTIELGA